MSERTQLMLLSLKRAGIERLPMPNYSWHTHAFIDLCQAVFEQGGDVYEGTETIKCDYRLTDIVTWQETVRVSNLLGLGAISHLQKIVLVDHATCYVTQWQGLNILMCGNHRFWWLWQLGYTNAAFWTVRIP